MTLILNCDDLQMCIRLPSVWRSLYHDVPSWIFEIQCMFQADESGNLYSASSTMKCFLSALASFFSANICAIAFETLTDQSRTSHQVSKTDFNVEAPPQTLAPEWRTPFLSDLKIVQNLCICCFFSEKNGLFLHCRPFGLIKGSSWNN